MIPRGRGGLGIEAAYKVEVANALARNGTDDARRALAEFRRGVRSPAPARAPVGTLGGGGRKSTGGSTPGS